MTPALLLSLLLGAGPAKAPRPTDEKPPRAAPIKKEPEAGCDQKILSDLRKALATAENSRLTATTSQGLAEACESKLPAPLYDALYGMHHGEVDEHGAQMLKAFGDEPAFVKASCPKWDEAFGNVAHSAPGDKLHALYKDCGLAKLKFVTEDEYVATVDLAAAYVAGPLYTWLVAHGMEAGSARKLMRALLAAQERGSESKKKPEKEKGKPKK